MDTHCIFLKLVAGYDSVVIDTSVRVEGRVLIYNTILSMPQTSVCVKIKSIYNLSCC